MPLKIYDSIEPAGYFKVTGAKNVWTEDGKDVEGEIKNLKSQLDGLETIFAKQEVTGFAVNDAGIYSAGIETKFELVAGENYVVDFDGERFEYTAEELTGTGIIALGETNGDPFMIMYVTDEVFVGGNQNGVSTVKEGESHIIGVYKKANYATEEFVKEYVAKNGQEIPVFDLAALGLAAIPITGGAEMLETDTTEIIKAFEKGSIAVVVSVDVGGQTMSATLVMNPAGANGSYQSISLINLTEPAMVTLNVDNGTVVVVLSSLKEAAGSENAVAASVDLSAYESGTITETYPDGSVITYSFEFDSEGNPTKMTDSSGNETTFIW